MSLHIEGTRMGDKALYWPTWSEWAWMAGRASIAVLALSTAFTAGSATMARLYLDGRQEILDERARTDRCIALVDEGTGLVLDATLMARARTGPRAEPWVPLDVTVDGWEGLDTLTYPPADVVSATLP